MKLCSFDFKSIAQLQIDQDCLGCDKKWKQSYEYWKSDEKEVFIYLMTMLWTILGTKHWFFCVSADHIHSIFFPLVCLQVPCQWNGISLFLVGFHCSRVRFIPVLLFAFSTDKDEKCLPLSFSYKMPTGSNNNESVLSGLFSPLTHFNAYQLQVLVLPKILRMQIKIPFS